MNSWFFSTPLGDYEIHLENGEYELRVFRLDEDQMDLLYLGTDVPQLLEILTQELNACLSYTLS